MSKRGIVIGTLILTAANLITRLMGFFYRVFMSNAMGAEGMGLYQLILPIYILAWSITSAGFTTTISRLTARENAVSEQGNMASIVKRAIFLSIAVSAVVSCCLFIFAENIALVILQDVRAALSLKVLSLAVPFMAVGSCIRGFFLGLQSPVIPAVSQVIEQAVRIMIIYVLAGVFVPMGLTYACLAAVFGILFGEFFSFLFTALGYYGYRRKKGHIKKPTLSAITVYSRILAMALPLSATKITASLLSATENILIPRQLQLYGQNTAEALSSYGELTGMAIPLIMLPSACLMAASVSLVPEISEASAVKEHKRISSTVSVTFLFTFIIAFGAAALFSVFPKEICYVVYSRASLGELLFPLAFLCPFLYIQTILQGLLNGFGEQFFLFRNSIIASFITIGGIWFFMPLYGIPAFIVSWAGGLCFSVLSALHKLYVLTGVHPDFYKCLIKPFLAGVASALIIRYCIQISEPSKMLYITALLAMGLLYLVFLIVLGCFSEENRRLFFGDRKFFS